MVRSGNDFKNDNRYYLLTSMESIAKGYTKCGWGVVGLFEKPKVCIHRIWNPKDNYCFEAKVMEGVVHSDDIVVCRPNPDKPDTIPSSIKKVLAATGGVLILGTIDKMCQGIKHSEEITAETGEGINQGIVCMDIIFDHRKHPEYDLYQIFDEWNLTCVEFWTSQ